MLGNFLHQRKALTHSIPKLCATASGRRQRPLETASTGTRVGGMKLSNGAGTGTGADTGTLRSVCFRRFPCCSLECLHKHIFCLRKSFSWGAALPAPSQAQPHGSEHFLKSTQPLLCTILYFPGLTAAVSCLTCTPSREASQKP